MPKFTSKLTLLRSGIDVPKRWRAGSKAAVVAVAAVIVLGACGGNPESGRGPLRQSSDGPSNSSASWKEFIEPSPLSGCPSAACSDILAQVQAGATTRTVPSDLTPSLKDVTKDLQPGAARYQIEAPQGGSCSELPVSELERVFQPCVFGAGASPSAPLMILIGNSRALMWSRAVLALASRLGYRFAFVQHEGCSMAQVDDPPRTGSASAAECKEWRDAAIDWVNNEKPAVAFVAGGPDLNNDNLMPNGSVSSPAELTTGYTATLKKLQGPGRKLFVLGELPSLKEDPPRCLAAHDSSSLKCATPASEAIAADEMQAGVDAARQSSASYVNVTPWLCTVELCPAIVGHYLAYRDQHHLTTAFAETLVPVLQQTVNIGHA